MAAAGDDAQAYSVSLGGSCAIDSIVSSIIPLFECTSLSASLHWVPYGYIWMPASRDISRTQQSTSTHFAFLRVEDFVSEHPELFSSLEEAGSRAKCLTKAARQAEVLARRATKRAKKRQIDSPTTRSHSPTQAGVVANFTGLKGQKNDDYLLSMTCEQLKSVSSSAIKALLLACLGLSRVLHSGGSSWASQERQVHLLPEVGFKSSSEPALLRTLQQFGLATMLCAKCCKLPQSELPVQLSCKESCMRVKCSSANALHHDGELNYRCFEISCDLLGASWHASFTVAELDDAALQASGEVSILMTHANHTHIHASRNFLQGVPEPLVGDGWFDPFGAIVSHNPFTPEFWSLASRRIVQSLHSKVCTTQKVVVLDCDNTLWEGAVGELGPAGVVLSARCLQLQRVAKRLQHKGLILAISSKNELTDIKSVFKSRAGEMELLEADITVWKVNWQRKSDSIVAISQELGVGLDSFAFIDDNPVEIAEVNSSIGDGLAGVTAIQLPKSLDWAVFLDSHWLLNQMLQDSTPTSKEDTLRTQFYQQNATRQAALQTAASFPAFLASLNLKLEVEADECSKQARIAQLTLRTNQFNVNKQVLSEASVRDMIESGDCAVLSVTVTDRFGCYGLVGAVIMDTAAQDVADLFSSDIQPKAAQFEADPALVQYGARLVRCGSHPQAGTKVIRLHQFLMSCRILHRGVEHAQLRAAAQRADESGADLLAVQWRPSERNEPAARFFFGSLKEHTVFVPDTTAEPIAERSLTPALQQQPLASQKTPVSSKPPAGWIYIPVKAARSVKLSPEDTDIEEVFGSSSDDAKQAAKIATKLAGATAAAAGVGASEPQTVLHGSTGPSTSSFGVANDRGVKLCSKTYEILALFNTGMPSASAAFEPESAGLALDDDEVSAAAQAEIDAALKQFPSSSAHSVLQTSEAHKAFQAKQLLETQAHFRRKMRLQAKVMQRKQLQQAGDQGPQSPYL